MKKIAFIIAPVIVAFFMASCSKTDLPPNPTSQQDVASKYVANSWKVSYYAENNQPETGQLTSYTFTFSDDGTLSVTDGTNTYGGTWTVVNSSDPIFDEALNISINGNALSFLETTWLITSINNNTMKLLYGGPTTTMQVYFDSI